MSANERQVGGEHYRTGQGIGLCPNCRSAIQHWDWACNLSGLEYAATKYLSRWRQHKDGLGSLQKVLHYVQKIIEQHFPDMDVSITVARRSQPVRPPAPIVPGELAQGPNPPTMR